MKVANLFDSWSSPDNTRLTPKQFSFRLPIHVAAKISALSDMFPQQTRTQIVSDLLTSALDEFEKELPESPGDPVREDYAFQIAEQLEQSCEPLFFLGGQRGRFRSLANQYFADLEKDLDSQTSGPLFPDIVGTLNDFKKK